MKRKKLSNKTKGKILIISAVLVPIVILLVILFSRFDFDYFWNEFLKKTVDNAIGKGSHIVILSLIACPVILLSMVAIIDHVIPVLCFFISKPLKYFTIWRLCLKNRYSCRFLRAPWLSLKGVEELADVEIQMKGKMLYIHFVDVPFPVLRMFLLINDRQYRMHRSIPGNLIAMGLAILGYLNPIEGALIHNIGSVVVIICSSSLINYKISSKNDKKLAKKNLNKTKLKKYNYKKHGGF